MFATDVSAGDYGECRVVGHRGSQVTEAYVSVANRLPERALLVGHVPVPMATISADGHGAREGPADGY